MKLQPSKQLCFKDCPERDVMCHATCEHYLTRKKEYDERKKREQQNRENYRLSLPTYIHKGGHK